MRTSNVPVSSFDVIGLTQDFIVVFQLFVLKISVVLSNVALSLI